MSDLANKECVPCRGGVPPMGRDRINELLKQLRQWQVHETHHLTKTYSFPDFVTALAFVNKIGALAEKESHHPDIFLSWGKVRVDIWTHKIDGLTESDFVLAAKLDALG